MKSLLTNNPFSFTGFALGLFIGSVAYFGAQTLPYSHAQTTYLNAAVIAGWGIIGEAYGGLFGFY